MNKLNQILCVSLALFLGGISSIIAQKSKKSKRPNVVLILSDDQGNNDASYQRSSSKVSTPSIDKLAKDGVVFTNGYASGYVCSPTRAGLMTGRYQQRFGFYRAPDSRIGLPLSEITLADVLKKNGYKTGAFGKWHLGLTEAYHPNNRGFDEFYGFLGHGAHDYFDLTLKKDPSDFHQAIYRNLEKIEDEGYLTDILAKEANNFIKANANKKDPFFVYLPFNAVHSPMQAPKDDIDKFNTGDTKRDIYLAMLLRMDIAVGNVIKTLKDEGVYDNTIIIFLSDNGGAAGNSSDNLPYRGTKHTVYEGGYRVPFIISWPKEFKHAKNDEPVISVDLMPTICAAVGVELPDNVYYDGKNIIPVIEGKLKTPLHEQLYFDGNDGSWAIREGHWKLLFSKKKNLELYNLNTDETESENLVEKEVEIVADLKAKYMAWRSEMEEPMGGYGHLNGKKKKKNKTQKRN